MADIFHDFPIQASPQAVFQAMSSPEGLSTWWPKEASGIPEEGNLYELHFGPGYTWQARVRRCVPEQAFELEIITSDPDWSDTRVGFELTSKMEHTHVHFYNKGWPEKNGHYRQSSYCWAMYLRLLKRYVEVGEVVPYEARLEA